MMMKMNTMIEKKKPMVIWKLKIILQMETVRLIPRTVSMTIKSKMTTNWKQRFELARKTLRHFLTMKYGNVRI